MTKNISSNKILLKYSGEAVAGIAGQGIDPKILHYMSKEIKSVVEQNIAVGLVIGGGNLFRGQELNQDGIDRVAGDHMGLLRSVPSIFFVELKAIFAKLINVGSIST